MNKLKLAAVAIILLCFFALALLNLAATGFFGMPVGQQFQVVEEAPVSETGLGINLEFSVLEKTKLSIVLESSGPAAECPVTTDIGFTIRNLGLVEAKKVSVGFPANIKVVACENCYIDSLSPFSTVFSRAKLCNYSEAENVIEINAVNAPAVQVSFA